jgi:FKBP-type peptidyl-prolyl cis-trans isomerase
MMRPISASAAVRGFVLFTALSPLSLAQEGTPPVKPPAANPIPECKEMTKTASGLEIGFLKKGNDEAPPSREDTVEVHYTGWLLDGTKFDSSRDSGVPYRTACAGEIIMGWTEALLMMTPGARCKLVIPADLAYGAGGRPGIPPNATLVFDVELLKVVRMPKCRPANKDAQKETKSKIKWETAKAGDGKAVPAGKGLSLRYAIWNSKGDLLDCTEKQNGQTIGGTLAALPTPFLAEIAANCTHGSIVRADVPKAVWPNAGDDTIWELELVAVNDLPEFRDLDPAKTVTTQSGLQYEVIAVGDGASPKATDTVSAHYTGWLTDGKSFDSSHARGMPTQFPLNRVIAGWTEGLQLMKPGGKFLFRIPAALGYREQGAGESIPPNATLVFLVELEKIVDAPVHGGR